MVSPAMGRHQSDATEATRELRGLRVAESPQSKPVQELMFGDVVCFYGDSEQCQKTPMLFLYGIQARPGRVGCASGSTETDIAKSLRSLQVATAMVYIQTGWEGEELVGSTYLVDPTKLASWPAVDTPENRCARSPPMQPFKHVHPSLPPRSVYTGSPASIFPRHTRRRKCHLPLRTTMESLLPLSTTSQ